MTLAAVPRAAVLVMMIGAACASRAARPPFWGITHLKGGGDAVAEHAVTAATSSEHFDELLADAAARGVPVVVDFSATWCGPCQSIAPAFAALAAEHAERALFVKVDVDECSEVAERFDVASMPTFVLLAPGGGDELARVAGADVGAVAAAVEDALGGGGGVAAADADVDDGDGDDDEPAPEAADDEEDDEAYDDEDESSEDGDGSEAVRGAAPAAA